jgi:hypothetical protein
MAIEALALKLSQPDNVGHVRLRVGKRFWEKEFRLENGKTGDNCAIRQVGGFLDMLAVVGVFRHADFGLQNFHQLLNAVFLSAQLLEGLQDLAQLTRSLVVCEAVNVFPYVLFHGSLQLSTIQSLAIRGDRFIAREW